MKNKIYIQMFSIHGLVRSQNMELGRDADTGGQVNYVIELCNALSQCDQIKQVDLLTRWISDKSVSDDYSQHIENVNDKFRIVRIRCGGAKYLRKELLWKHLDEYVDKTVRFIKREKQIPDVVHGHYADAGYVAMQLSQIFGMPFLFTGHSLGRNKKEKLLRSGMRLADMNKKLNIDHRIGVEEDVLKYADRVIVSTHQEIREQYGIYKRGDLPEYKVIPPGIDVDKFYPYYRDILPDNDKGEEAMYAQASVLQELDRFFSHPDKPIILALCRPDKRKNINGLIDTYGKDLQLQAMANLAVFAGIRKDISQMEDNEREVLTDMLLLMDKYDLYGKMAIPKKHDFEHEVPELYRIAAIKKGVFINPALTEPFGLTLLEASATGVPVVATSDGGPQDIVANCKNGILVDPTDTSAMASALKEILTRNNAWETYSKNGIINVRKHYTWETHAQSYLHQIETILDTQYFDKMKKAQPSDAIGRRLAKINRFIITDIDNTLIGKDNSKLDMLLKLIKTNRDKAAFGVATGRTVSSAVEILRKYDIPDPDVVISSVGSEIYYGKELHYGQGWETHIANNWDRDKIVDLMRKFEFLEYQSEDTQRRFKISYNMKPEKDRLAMIHDLLLKNRCRYNLIYSHAKYLDILPYRASKGKAIRYLSYKWEIPLSHFLVCGDSGNDEEMLRGEPRAVIVGNYSPELNLLKGGKHIYFAQSACAGGILEGIEKYKFLKNGE